MMLPFNQIRQTTESICETLTAEDMLVQPEPDASPLKWHLAHTTWFFYEMVLQDKTPLEKEFGQLFCDEFHTLYNSYYEGLGTPWPRGRRGIVSRPSLEDIRRFRTTVTQLIQAELDQGILDLNLLEIGMHHEQQHQELMYYDLLSSLFHNGMQQPYGGDFWRDKVLTAPANKEEYVFPSEQVALMGHPANDRFAYDNEQPAHRVVIHPFAIDSRLVTVAEFLPFLEDGGYKKAEWWLADGWNWVQKEKMERPRYWQKIKGKWLVFDLHAGWRPLAPNEIVTHLSYFEADAFARWTGKRLPTEGEWEVAFRSKFDPAHLSWQHQAWQWTSSDYAPYPGYQSFNGALFEYNSKFMHGQKVCRGGSFATPAGHRRGTYRNFFYPHQRWQLVGLRLARSL